jgi:type I restriction enzyme M protein
MEKARSLALGLVFLRYMCASFEELRGKIVARPRTKSGGKNALDEELPQTYQAAGVFFVPESARWDRIFPPNGTAALADAADVPALVVDAAIRAIEKENPTLFPAVLRDAQAPKAVSRQTGSPSIPRSLVRLLGGLSSGEAAKTFGSVFKECAKLAEFDHRESKAGFRAGSPVPAIVAELLAGMLEPYKGRFCDPCCGSGEILAGAADFIHKRQGKLADLSFYAQERDAQSVRIAAMNLAVRGVDTSQIRQNSESPLQRDLHRDLKFDFLAACPSFKESGYPWIQYILARLSPTGLGALVLPKSSLSSLEEEGIRRTLVESRLVDCVVSLPARLFPGATINPCVWFLSRAKTSRGRRADEVLFIDAQGLGKAISRREWELSGEDIGRVARTYHNWRFPKASPYRDTPGFSVSAPTARIREAGCNLNPAVYLGLPETGDDAGSDSRLSRLRAEFEALVKEEPRVSRGVVESLRKIRLDD